MYIRTGPHPLLLHLGLPFCRGSHATDYSEKFARTFQENELIEMVRGIQMYQNSSHQAVRPKIENVKKIGAASLQTLSSNNDRMVQYTPLLIIPSLVNKSYIFNLNESRSILKWFQHNNVSAYLLDWGDLSSREFFDMHSLINEIILPSVKFIADVHGGSKINLLGYCMGGALSLATAALLNKPADINKIVLLASPWDFNSKENELSKRVKIWSPYALNAIAEKGVLPQYWIQALFASHDPDASVQKFIKFAEMQKDSDEAHMFIEVEDWVNDNVDIPENIALHCLNEWFSKNVLVQNQWHCNENHINLDNIESSILIAASDFDRLVPYKTAIGAKTGLRNASVCDVLKVQCGHIGFIAGKNSLDTVWRPITDWLKKNP